MKTVEGFFSLFSFLPIESKVLLIGAFLAALFANFLFIKKNDNVILFLMLAAFLIGSCFALIDPFLHTWDESFHALVAKNTAEGYLSPHLFNEALFTYNIENWVGNYIWLHKPPLSLWQMAMSIDVFGAYTYPSRLPSVLAFTATTYFVYSIGYKVFNRNTAFYGALLFVLYQFSLEQVAGVHTADHIDVSFMMYVTASLWAWIHFQHTKRKPYLLAIGVFAGLAVLTKWLVGLLIFGAWGGYILMMVFSRRDEIAIELRYFLSALFVAIFVAAPWNIYAALKYPKEYWYEFSYAKRHLNEVIEQHGGDTWFYWDNLSTLFGAGTLIPVIVSFAVFSLMYTVMRQRDKLMLLFYILIPYLFFTLATTKMSNFVNIVSPIILIAIAALFSFLLDGLKKRVRLSQAWSLLLVPFLFLFLLRPNQTIKNHLFEEQNRRQYSVGSQSFIRGMNVQKDELFLYVDFYNYEHIIHMFYHQGVAIPHVPDNKELSRLKNEGKNIVVVYKSDFPQLSYTPEGTRFIKMKLSRTSTQTK